MTTKTFRISVEDEGPQVVVLIDYADGRGPVLSASFPTWRDGLALAAEYVAWLKARHPNAV